MSKLKGIELYGYFNFASLIYPSLFESLFTNTISSKLRGSKSDFWTNLVGSAINKSIIIGEDSNLGPSLGAARLAMMATKNFASKDVFKKMPIRKETSVDKKLSEMLNKRYAIWSEIVSTNLKIAGKLKI